jgi:Uma2 family endonuclease
MGATAEVVKVTYADLVELPDDGKRHELFDGEHTMTPAPTPRHQRVTGRIFAAIHAFLLDHPLGEVFAAPVDVVLSEVDVVQPDVVFVSAPRAGMVTEHNLAGPPDLLVEVLSAGSRRRDEVVKRQVYARFGVREYWVVDPELETVRVLALTGASYREVTLLSGEARDALTTDLLPGLAIPVARLFA